MLEKANPSYVEKKKILAAKEEKMFKKRQFTKTLNAVREEYKAGIKVSRVPPEIANIINAMTK